MITSNMDPCAAQLGKVVLPHCEHHHHPRRCCESLQRPVGCDPRWTHAFDIHAARAWINYGCAANGNGQSQTQTTQSQVSVDWCDECRYLACDSVAWHGVMTPACAHAMMSHCGVSDTEECVFWRTALNTCGQDSPKWRECSMRVRATQHSMVDDARRKRDSARFQVVQMTKEAWEFTQTFGCGPRRCVPLIASLVNDSSTVVARAAFGHADVAWTVAPQQDVNRAAASVVLLLVVAIAMTVVDFVTGRSKPNVLVRCIREL